MANDVSDFPSGRNATVRVNDVLSVGGNQSITVAFKKPGQMRWEYETPSKKSFVLTSDTVYAYDPAAMTVTKARLGADQLSASVTFLWGKGQLADELARGVGESLPSIEIGEIKPVATASDKPKP